MTVSCNGGHSSSWCSKNDPEIIQLIPSIPGFEVVERLVHSTDALQYLLELISHGSWIIEIYRDNCTLLSMFFILNDG